MGNFTILDCRTGKQVSDHTYATAAEAGHDYHMNAGQTCVGLAPDARRRLRLPHTAHLSAVIGSPNWVLHRRTKRMIEKYGEDVVCLTGKQYDAVVDKALAMLEAA